MILRGVVVDRFTDDDNSTVEITSKEGFTKLGNAAARWALRKARSMPLYGADKTFHLELRMSWVEPAPPVTNHQSPVTRKGKHARKTTSSRSPRSGR